jgi:cytidylate kinase
MIKNKIIIAIDGHSSCGKSTLAKALAKELGYVFIDSGAMYRAVTYAALKGKMISTSEFNIQKLIKSLAKLEIEFKLNRITKSPEIFLNGKNIADDIRKPEIANFVSQVAEIKEVRQKLVSEQQKMGVNGGIVMDGRDIGSVVFPDAELKFFVTADIETRTNRRFDELVSKGINISKTEVRENLIKRDEIDSSRKESPLVKTADAIVIDNSNITKSEQLDMALIHTNAIITQNSLKF